MVIDQRGIVSRYCISLRRFLQVVTGEAQITYTNTYKSELDDMKLELTRTQNELNAYKDAYPEGLSEQRLHDLNQLNSFRD